MALSERLAPGLQESILATLYTDDRWGYMIAQQVEPGNFDEGLFREVSEPVLKYQKRYKKAPGWAHVDDRFGDKLSDSSKSGPALRKILGDLITLAKGINAEYVANRAGDFIKEQKVKSTLFEAAERYQQGGSNRVDEVLGILGKVGQINSAGISAGTFLNTALKDLSWMREDAVPTIELGIPEFDRRRIGPARKELFLFIGGKGTGKSFFECHVGKRALMQPDEKVLHVSLENSEVLTVRRYIQGIFAAGWDDEYTATTLELQNNQIKGLRTSTASPKINFRDPAAFEIMSKKHRSWGARLGNLVVKNFPSGQLTLGKLNSYLDYLQSAHNFEPTVLLIDYPDIMYMDQRDLRASMNTTFVGIRGIAVERVLAAVVPTQPGRSGLNASQVSSAMVSEDIRKIHISDNVISYSQQRQEKAKGIARLRVEHARNARDGMSVVITQAYSIGQFVMQSAPASAEYRELIKQAGKRGSPTADVDKEADEDAGTEE